MKYIKYIPLNFSSEEMLERSSEFRKFMDSRRSIREFSDKEVPEGIVENIVMTASSAPSGAHKQPWTFCIVKDKELKNEIRIAAEEEEYENYHGRMDEQWLKDLEKFGTDWNKPFLESAPYLIVIFKKLYDISDTGEKLQNYYVNESVGIACGFLLTAIHNAGLCALTHTPSPMGFLTKILKRPENERPFLLIPVGYPAENCVIPQLKRKNEEDVIKIY